MKSISTKKISTEAAPSVIIDDEAQDADQRLQYITTAAYYKAKERGFVPGMEIDDWLEAEAEYDADAEDPQEY